MVKLNLKKIQSKAEEIKKSEKERKSGGDSVFLNKFPVGTVEIRCMPPWSSAGELAKEVYTHFKLPPGNTTIVDVEKTYPDLGQPNPINRVLENFKDVLDVSRLWSKPTPKMNIYLPDSEVNQDNDELDKELLGKVVVASPPRSVFNEIVKMIANPRIGDITDPHDGFPVTVEKTTGKKWQDTKYSTNLIPERGPLDEDEDEVERIMEKIHDLDKFFPAPDDAKIAEMHTVAKALRKHLEGECRRLGAPIPEEEDEYQAPRKSKRRKPKLVEPGDEEDEDEDDAPWADDDDDDEEEEKLLPKKKAKKKATNGKKPSTKKRKTSRKKSSSPSQPECFADPDVYKVDDDQEEVCSECIWEVPCSQAQKKAGTFRHDED